MKRLTHQVGAFAGIGAIATIVHICVGIAMFRLFGFSPLIANLIAFAAATCVTIFANAKVTFRDSSGGKPSLIKALVTVLIGLALNQLIVFVATEYAGASYEVALALVLILVPAATFALFRFWAFRSN